MSSNHSIDYKRGIPLSTIKALNDRFKKIDQINEKKKETYFLFRFIMETEKVGETPIAPIAPLNEKGGEKGRGGNGAEISNRGGLLPPTDLEIIKKCEYFSSRGYPIETPILMRQSRRRCSVCLHNNVCYGNFLKCPDCTRPNDLYRSWFEFKTNADCKTAHVSRIQLVYHIHLLKKEQKRKKLIEILTPYMISVSSFLYEFYTQFFTNVGSAIALCFWKGE